ncbi:MAG: hypothetical protein HOP30_20325 [Cyclobacteriaceae bacterium]|nr:hypothetical protein [Cyclobacteriaceae bacterium]
MNYLILTLIAIVITLNSYGQRVQIDTLVVPVTSSFARPNTKLRFPVLRTGNEEVDKVMNNDLKNRYTDNEFIDKPTDSTLILWADETLVHLSFGVTYMRNNLLSFTIYSEGCGAYCSSWTDYFTYNTKTGKYISISDVVDTLGEFRTKVYADLAKQFKQQKEELRADSRIADDKETYEWALRCYEDIERYFSIEPFVLNSEHLEIIVRCDMPNAIKNLTPIINLNYRYDDIMKYLKLKHLKW